MADIGKPIFLISGQRPKPFSKLRLLADVRAARRDLTNRLAYIPKSGLSSHTIITGKEVFKGPDFKRRVFERSPKRGQEIAKFLIEPEVMRRLEGKDLPVRVPRVTSLQKDPPWFGIEFMDGVPLRNVMRSLTSEKFDLVTQPLGLFMAAMQKAIPLSVGLEKWIAKDAAFEAAKVRNVLDRPEIQEALGSLLPVCQQAAITLDKFRPIMTHGDLQPSNILVDEKTLEVKSIIDFGYARFRLPQAELSKLRRAYSVEFVDKVRVVYSDAQDQKVERQDVILWDIASHIMKASRFIQIHNERALQQTIEKIGDLSRELDKTRSQRCIALTVSPTGTK